MATAERTQAHWTGSRLAQAKLDVLAARRNGWSAQHCADQIGVSRRTLYDWTEADLEFAAAWADAYEGGSDWCEDKLRDRVEGGNTDATLAMLRIRRRLVPDGPPPVTLIQVIWQGTEPPALPGPHIIDVGAADTHIIEGKAEPARAAKVRALHPSQQPQSASPASPDTAESTP